MLDAHDLAKVHFSAARAEVIARLGMREQVLLAAVATFGVTAGVTVALSPHRFELLSVFPVLSAAFSFLMFRHNWTMHALSDYLNIALEPFLGLEEGCAEVLVPLHWDAALHRRAKYGYRLKYVRVVELASAWVLLWVPGAVAWYLATRQHLAGKTATGFIVADAVCLLVALVPFAHETYRLLRRWQALHSRVTPPKPSQKPV